jgi:hypothetical protein
MLEVFVHQSRSGFAGLDFSRIVSISILQMMEQISERKTERIPAELEHVNKFVKNEFNRASVCRIDGAMFGSDIDVIAQCQSRHIPVPGNPPKRNPSARAKSNYVWVAYAGQPDSNPPHQRIRQMKDIASHKFPDRS